MPSVVHRFGHAWLLCLALLLVPTAAHAAPGAKDADALFEKAAAHFDAGRYDQAIPLLAQAAAIDEKLGDARRPDLAYDRLYLGLCYANTGRSDKGSEQLASSAALFAALGRKKDQVEALNHLGLLEYYRAAYDAAEHSFQAALEVARAAQLATQVPATLNNLGLVRAARGKYDEALELYRAAYDEHVKAGNTAAAAQSLGNIASVYLFLSRWSEAEEAYRGALASFDKLGDKAGAAATRINLGILHASRSSYGAAREALEQGLAEATALGLRQHTAYGLGSLAGVLYATGRYDQAEQTYRQALRLDREFDLRLNVVSDSTGLGRVYQAWGRYDQALDLYQESREAARRYGVPDQALAALQLIGSVHAALGRHDTAIEEYGRALAEAGQSGREAAKLPILDALGSAWFELRDVEKAGTWYRAALDLARKLEMPGMAARELIHLGAVSQVAGDVAAADRFYRDAVAVCRAAGSRADEATALNDLGTLALTTGAWREAADWLLQAIAIKEQLRSTATGADRMDFLASQISSYQWLVAARVRGGDPAGAVEASELSKARWLSEQLGTEGGAAGFPGVRALQAGLSERTLILDYANMDAATPVLMCISRDAVRAWDLALPGAPRTDAAAAVTDAGTGRDAEPSRGFVVVRTAPRPSTFSDVVAAYLGLLRLARPTTEERAERDRLSRELYDALLGPAAQELSGKDELIVVPEGSLCALPLETLLMSDGRWLVERFHVTYVPSLTVRAQLAGRRAAAAGRPMLALGGALYGGRSTSAQRSVSDQQLASLRLDAARLLGGRRGMRELYATLGLDGWDDLPGTLGEVTEISRLAPGATVLTGAQASEQRIKDLSRTGELQRFGVIHFATHGIAVPEAPELSALVLSQKDLASSTDDGYLTAHEIAGLRLGADFVNLSACETGLGRNLGGEGIIGLSQAFLAAGASGLSVSLWPVADDATRQFMIELYRANRERVLSFARAMTEVKRRFIREGTWREPVYWAPFVYYGVDAAE
jgi:CHAT domain-containing protein/tetratricopeptide (TPR) repeat protein